MYVSWKTRVTSPVYWSVEVPETARSTSQTVPRVSHTRLLAVTQVIFFTISQWGCLLIGKCQMPGKWWVRFSIIYTNILHHFLILIFKTSNYSELRSPRGASQDHKSLITYIICRLCVYSKYFKFLSHFKVDHFISFIKLKTLLIRAPYLSFYCQLLPNILFVSMFF